jgi:peptidoglycan/xylan/chitin deacetylase (PgdA/CDA1 family)
MVASGAAETPGHFLYERYQQPGRRSQLLRLYYGLKPLLPRPLQLTLRRAYARRQAARGFPAWPMERVLLELRDQELRRRLRETGLPRLPLVGYWPHGRRFAVIITHDVEGPAGIENIPRLLELEQRHGFISSWNFCAEWYPIPEGLFESLRKAGCEIGLHGILHDGKLFRDRASFEANLPKIHRYMREWGASGFRSPATHRNADWMPELGCLYDTSFPDTDPFEPQSGGCCSIFPFLNGDLVELPITLAQDHTLFEILREESIRRWVEKSRWIIENNGLINLLVHPDYLLTRKRLDLYDEFLSFLRSQLGGWHALPRDVARWWKRRESIECRWDGNGGASLVAGDAVLAGASVMWAHEDGGRIRLDLDGGPASSEGTAASERAASPAVARRRP